MNPVSTPSPQAASSHDARLATHLPPAVARLVRAVQELSHARTLETVQEIVRHAAREITGADGATFVLREGEFCHYVDEDAIAPLWKGQRFPLSACVSGWSMLHGESAVIEDIFHDSRVPVDAYRSTFVRSMVMVPIRTSQPIGAIGSYWSAAHRATPAEIEVLEALANTTAVALENVQIYQELEHRVRIRTRALEHANEELASFAASVSHDLRAPLAVISGYTDLLKLTGAAALDEKSRRFLEQIPAQVTRMTALIDDLLRLARIRSTELSLTPVDLAAMATSVAGVLTAAEPERSVQFEAMPGAPVLGDEPLLRIALENLLANAWKYTRRIAAPRIVFGEERDEHGARVFFVRDNGVGFAPEEAGKLFVPFHRLHSYAEYPGTGVGLTIVGRIIEKHGGHIWAHGQPGEGAVFSFTLAPRS